MAPKQAWKHAGTWRSFGRGKAPTHVCLRPRCTDRRRAAGTQEIARVLDREARPYVQQLWQAVCKPTISPTAPAFPSLSSIRSQTHLHSSPCHPVSLHLPSLVIVRRSAKTCTCYLPQLGLVYLAEVQGCVTAPYLTTTLVCPILEDPPLQPTWDIERWGSTLGSRPT